MHKPFEMINREFKAQERKYQVLANFRNCCKELRRLKVTRVRASIRSFFSVLERKHINIRMYRIVLNCRIIDWPHASVKFLYPFKKINSIVL